MYYCKTCEKVCDRDEVDLVEKSEEGDWVEIHIKCDEEVMFL